jgi:nitroreductase
MIGDGVKAASDVGLYAQNFLLSLAARGYSGIPQTMIGSYAGTVRSALVNGPELKMLFAISFGLPDNDSPLRRLNTPRVPLENTVVLHGTKDVLPAHDSAAARGS